MKITTTNLETAVGGLSNPEKMPGFGYSTPASGCRTGSRLAAVPGTVCSGCYALKGRYVMPNVTPALDRRLGRVRAALADPSARERFVSAFADLLNRRLANYRKRRAADRPTANDARYFRWHDSGDLQGPEHLELIADIARRTPGVRHWLPTREYADVLTAAANGLDLPPNLRVRLSAHKRDHAGPDAGHATSAVTTNGEQPGSVVPDGPLAGHYVCRASLTVKNGAIRPDAPKDERGYCGTCRVCWDSPIPVVYPLH